MDLRESFACDASALAILEAEDAPSMFETPPPKGKNPRLRGGDVRHMHNQSALKRAYATIDNVIENHGAIGKVHDKKMLRKGDKLKVFRPQGKLKSVQQVKQHANTWLMRSCSRVAYTEVGQRPTASRARTAATVSKQNALGETCRGLELSSAVSQIHHEAQVDALDKSCLCDARLGLISNLFVGRHYDATPKLVEFGALQPEVCPHARYFKLDDDGKWKTITQEEWSRDHKGGLPGRGTLELLAQNVQVGWVSMMNDRVEQASLLIPPCFLQDGKASTVFTATENAVGGLSTPDLVKLADSVDFIWLSEVPDSGKAMIRKKAATFEMLRLVPNAMVSPVTGCATHLLHRCLTNSIRSETMVGDTFAAAFVASQAHYQNRILQAVRQHVDKTLDFNQVDVPDPAWGARTEALLKFCFMRDVRGRAHQDGSAKAARGAADVQAKIKLVLSGLSGDTTSPRVAHYELACGKCATRADAVELVVTSIISGEIILPSTATLCSKSRMGSCLESLAEQCPGRLIHDLYRQITDLAFPQKGFNAIILGADDEKDDFRKYIKGKIWRCKCLANSRELRARDAGTLFSTVACDWLWKRLEYLDEKQNAIQELLTRRTSPFRYTQDTLLDMLVAPQSTTDFGTIIGYMADASELRMMREVAFHTAVSMYVQIEWKFCGVYEDWPFPLYRAAVSDDDTRRQIVTDFFKTPQCDLEPLTAGKIYALHDDVDQMMQNQSLWKGLRLNQTVMRQANMHIERLLAEIKQSVAFHAPRLERVVSNGHLTQFIGRLIFEIVMI